jgi:hypothetical protein
VIVSPIWCAVQTDLPNRPTDPTAHGAAGRRMFDQLRRPAQHLRFALVADSPSHSGTEHKIQREHATDIVSYFRIWVRDPLPLDRHE